MKRARGFSLVEAVLAMGVAAILLVGMGGALTMSVSALDKGQDRNSGAVKAAEMADRILADLNEATAITEKNGQGVAMRVPDRDRDGTEEVVVYGWSGVSGAPLYRSLNGGAPQIVIEGVEALEIESLVRASGAAEDAEAVLIGYDTSLGASLRTAAISEKDRVAQYVKPAFASNVTSWTITRVEVHLARDATATGTLQASLASNDGWKPSANILSKVQVSEALLPGSAAYVSLPLTAGPMGPHEGVFIVLEDVGSSSLSCGTVGYGQGGSALPYNTYLAMSADSGVTWTGPQDTRDMRFRVYGKVTKR